MFIKTTRNSKGQAYYHVVESYRSEGKVKQRVLLSLGKEDEGKIQDLTAALSRHSESLQAILQAKSLDVKHTYIAGPLLVLERVMQDLGINEITVKIAAKHERLGFDLLRTLFTLVLIQVRQCQRLFRKLGFSLKRGRTVVAGGSPKEKRALKKTPDDSKEQKVRGLL